MLIVDVNANEIRASRFSHWLMAPKRFTDGQLELEISSSLGINWMRSQRLVIDVRNTLGRFKLVPSDHNTTPTNT